MSYSIAELPWLPTPPENFRARCKALATASDPGRALQELSTYRLDSQQATLVGKTIKQLKNSGANLEALTPFRLGILSDYTVDFLADVLPAACARHGVLLDVAPVHFGQMLQQALDPNSSVNLKTCDAILVLSDTRSLGLEELAAEAAAADKVRDALRSLRELSDALREHGNGPCIFSTLPSPTLPLFGSSERKIAGSPRWLIGAVNDEIVKFAGETGAYILDVAYIAESVGLQNWINPAQWNAFKLGFSADCNDIVADFVARLVGSIRGRARKCLVLDLDNTIWGGVIGDDGMEGIVIGNGSPRGEAFLAVQKLALQLKRRGVILAVSSKNTESVAREPFLSHPDMLLKESDISCFQANWIDKASNLEAIARSLNIGLDSLVLLDDNAAEREHVRAALPVVAVPELPKEPDWYPWFLASAGYFEATVFSDEDRIRADTYSANAKREEIKAKARDLGNYLESLEMALSIGPIDPINRQRVTQLINKSNQFNLTTRRYTEDRVAQIERDPSFITAQARLSDRISDLGLISVVICQLKLDDPSVGEIDTWLMSCRVLGRRVEDALLSYLAKALLQRGVKTLIGRYRPTAKNGMVADHYGNLGFAFSHIDGSDSLFLLDLDRYTPPQLPFKAVKEAPAA